MPKARETCTACSIRRQKCDKNIPCGRCIKRGVADKCTRHWSRQDGTRVAISSPQNHQQPLSSPSGSINPQYSISVLPDDGAPGSITPDNNISTLDFMTWKPSEAVALNGDVGNNQGSTLVFDPSNRMKTQESSVEFLQTLLPNVSLMWKLINFHEKKLLWYHGCYHGPTFNAQVQERLDRQKANADDILQIAVHDMQWTALLFSVIAGSLTSASDFLQANWGFSRGESLQLCTQWYKAATTCLRLGNYTSDHNVLGAQAIATLTMCAHTLGFSGDLHVHLGSALRIAQSLNIHRIKSDDPSIDASSPPKIRQSVLKKEIGRRLWSQLCIQDWFSIPLAEAHLIHQGHFITKKPANRDHITMEPLAENVPTYVSYGNYLYEIAALVADMHSKTVTLNTDYTRYQLVLEYDSRMRQLATTGRPHYFDVTVPIEDSWPWFVPWARRSLTICFAHKIMMIHRAFLKRSFTNGAFSFTRRTCIAASKTILNEAKSARVQDEPIIWIDNAFCIAAAITLALDICQRQPIEPEYVSHRALIEDCMQMLRNQANSILALRGINLLQILLNKSSQDVGSNSDAFLGLDSQQTLRSAVPILDAVHAATTRRDRQNEASTPAPRLVSSNDQPTRAREASSIDDLFVELFPPQAGFSNAYLFEELLDLSLER